MQSLLFDYVGFEFLDFFCQVSVSQPFELQVPVEHKLLSVSHGQQKFVYVMLH